MDYLVKPTPAEALGLLRESGRGDKNMVVIVGRCRVDYEGRARSTLDYGDRLVVVKADGTVMVHGNEKREPLNWQPPGAIVRYGRDRGLTIEAERVSPPEVIRIHFKRIQAIGRFRLEDAATLHLVGSEGDIVDRIVEDPSLVEPGLRVLEREKMTGSGFIDLFCRDRKGNGVVIEVKRRCVSSPAVRQLEAYLYDIRKEQKGTGVRGILCAPAISGPARSLIEEKGLEFREIGRDVAHGKKRLPEGAA